MCGTCGCSDGSGASIHAEDGTHTHVLADGTVITHRHGHGEDDRPHHHHTHDHAEEAGQGHAHGDPSADPQPHHHGHGPHAHTHSHAHGAAHALEPAVRGASMAGHLGHDDAELEARLIAENDKHAARNRGFFEGRGVLALNLMSSPGSGKTTLLERVLGELPGEAMVLEGDQETSLDAERLRATGARALQINTGRGCHLEASVVGAAVRQLDPKPGATLVIENVGNLVCPALFDLGETARIVLFSVTEGEDKPEKYPHMFRVADLVLLTKCDLLPHLDFDEAEARRSVASVNSSVSVLPISARTGAGLGDFLGWIESLRRG